MQSYKEPQQQARGALPAPPPGSAAPISLTMSLNGPPGYHMHAALPPGSIPGSLQAGGGSNGSAREVHGTAVDPSRAQREAYMTTIQQGTRSKPAAVGGMGGGGHAYPVRHDGMHMGSQPHSQLHHQHQLQQHHQQQPQHQQQSQHQQHHGMTGAHHRSSAVAMHQQHPQHHLYPQQQQQQQQHPGVQHPMQMSMAGKKDSRAGAVATGVFKTPSSSGYSVPTGHQTANGVPVHPQYPGYPVMKDVPPTRSDASVVMDHKHRAEAAASLASPMGGMSGYRLSGGVGSGGGSVPVDGVLSDGSRHQHQQTHGHPHQSQHPQMMMHAQQQQQQQHPQKVPHPYPQTTSHYPVGHAPQKSMMPPSSAQVPQHPQPHPQHPHAVPHQSPTRSGMSRSPASASGYGPGPANPQLHPSSHPNMSPGVKDHHLHLHQQSQPHPHHRPPTPTLQSAELHQLWPSSASGVMPRQVHPDVTKHATSDVSQQSGRPLMSMQPPAGSIRTGEPRVQNVPTVSDVGSVSGARAANPAMMLSNGPGLAAPLAKGSIQLGTPAMKPMTVNADVKIDGDVSRGSKPSPGNGSGVPLDLSKIRPETGRQGDAPLDLSVKTRKRSTDDASPVGLTVAKKPRQELASPRTTPDIYYQYRGERPSEEWSSAMTQHHVKSGSTGMRSSSQTAGMPSPTLHQGFKHHTSSPGAVPFSPGAAGQVSPLSTVAPKLQHGMTYPPADRPPPRGASSAAASTSSTQPPRQSIEMSFEGKVEDCTSLIPKLVQGISAPPAMISSLHSQLERAQHMQVRTDAMPGHPAGMHRKHPHQHPLPQIHQQQQQKPAQHKDVAGVSGSYALGAEKQRVPGMDEHMQKAMYQQQQQQQLQRHQQGGYLQKTPPNIPAPSRSYPQSTAAGSHVPEHASSDYVSSPHVMTSQPHHVYSQQQQQQQKYQQQLQQQQQAQYHHQQQQQQALQRQQQRQHMQMIQEQHQKQMQQQQQRQQQQQHHSRQGFAQEGKPSERRGSADGRYSLYGPREEEVRRARLSSPARAPDGHADDRLGWGPHHAAQPSPARAGSHVPVDSYAGKQRDRVQLARTGSKSDMVSMSPAGQEQRKTPQGEPSGKRKEEPRESYIVRRSSSENFDKHAVGSSPAVHPSPAAASQGAALSAPASKPVDPGAQSTVAPSESPVGRSEAGPAPMDVRRRSDSAGRDSQGSRSSSASRQVESSPSVSTPTQGSTPSCEQQSENRDGFQRPQQPATVGSGGKVPGRNNDVTHSDTSSIEEGSLSKPRETPSPRPAARTQGATEEFATPLSISIPSSPSVGPGSSSSVSSNKPASPAPPPPPPSGGSKMWSRKRMILNAVNQDESLKKSLGVSSVVPPGAKPDHQRLRQFSSSPPPSSPKMPILSPQEKGGDSDGVSGQNDDPPDLDPTPVPKWRPQRGTSSLVRTSGPAGTGTSTAGAAPAATSVPATQASPSQSHDGSTRPSPQEMKPPAAGCGSAVAQGVTVTPAAGDSEPQQDKGGSVVVRRCSVSGPDVDRPAAEAPSKQQQQQQQTPSGHGNVPFTCVDVISRPDAISRPDVIRRSSLDRPWGHQKNIPVANVAPFVHEISNSLQLPSTEPPANDSSQPKSEDSKSDQVGETKPVTSDAAGTKSPSHTPRHGKDSPGAEHKTLTQRSKTIKSNTLLKKLHRIKKSKPKFSDLEDMGVHPVPLKYKVLKSSSLSVDEQLDSLTADTEMLEKTLSGKPAKQKRAKIKKKSHSPGGEKAKPCAKDSSQEEVEGDEKGTAETPDKTQQKTKKDLALSREERAKRRALLRGKEEERERKSNRRQKEAKRTARRRLSSTNQKARELKRTALGRRPRREAAKRKGGQYNRNAAYEEEVRRDESRKAIRRARRHASNLARVRLQQQHHQADGDEPDDDDDDDDNSQDSQQLARDDQPWEATSGAHAQSVRSSRKSRSHRSVLGSGVFAGQVGTAAPSGSGGGEEGSEQEEEYCDDADDESKDVSEDDDGEDTEVGEGSSVSPRSKGRSLVMRKKKRGKLRPVRRKLLDSSFVDDTFEAASSEDVVLEGEESQDANSQSAIPVPPEVKRIAVNKNSGETLLHRAARLGNEEVTLYCLRSGEYSVNARDNAGYTALHESCVKGSVRVARHLILHGADVNCCSQDGIRPLHDAVENDHLEVARLLLSYGADPLIATYGGRTPLKIARSLVMYDMLKGYLGDLNGYGSEEERPWHMPGSYGLHAATGNPDNGFDVFADVPSDDDETEDEKLDKMFDDSIIAAVPTYELPGVKPHSNPQTVVFQDDLLRHLRISFKHFSSLSSCMRAQIHVPRDMVALMLERSAFRRGSQYQQALLEAEKFTAIPLSALRKVESNLEQLYRRSSSKSSSSYCADLQSESDASLIRYMGEMSLTENSDDGEDDPESSCDVKEMFKMTSSRMFGGKKTGGLRGLREKHSLSPFSSGEKAMTPWIKDEKSSVLKSETDSTSCLGFMKNTPLLRSSSRESLLSTPTKSPLSRSHSDRAAASPSQSEKTPVRRVLSEKTELFKTSPEDKLSSYSLRLVESSSLAPFSSSSSLSSSATRSSQFTLRAPAFQPTFCKTERKEGESATGFPGTPFAVTGAAAGVSEGSCAKLTLSGAKSAPVFGSLSSLEGVDKKGAVFGASGGGEDQQGNCGASDGGGAAVLSLGGGSRPSRRGFGSSNSAPASGQGGNASGVVIRSSGHGQSFSGVIIKSSSQTQSPLPGQSPNGAPSVNSSSAQSGMSSSAPASSLCLGFFTNLGRDSDKDTKLPQWSSSFLGHGSFAASSRSNIDAGRESKGLNWGNFISRGESSAPLSFPSTARESQKDSRAQRWSSQGQCSSLFPASSVSSSSPRSLSFSTRAGKESNRDFRTIQWPSSKMGRTKTGVSSMSPSASSSPSSASASASANVPFATYSSSPSLTSGRAAPKETKPQQWLSQAGPVRSSGLGSSSASFPKSPSSSASGPGSSSPSSGERNSDKDLYRSQWAGSSMGPGPCPGIARGKTPPIHFLSSSPPASSAVSSSATPKLGPDTVASQGQESASRDARSFHTSHVSRVDSPTCSLTIGQTSSRKTDEPKDSRAKSSQLDFGQMFSDESSSSSFTTVVDNLDYDSSRSPVSNAATVTNATSTTSSPAGLTSKDSSSSVSSASSSSSSVKSFGFGVFGSTVTGKDRNDNDISIFSTKKT